MTRQEQLGRTRPNSDEAGATPPFDAPCVTASVGSLPPQSRAARDPFGRVPEPEFRSCKTTSITQDRKSTRLNSSHQIISYAVFCLKKKKINQILLSYTCLALLQ